MKNARFLPVVCSLLIGGSVACAQQGDRAGEAQPDLPDTIVVPPAPVLSASRALQSLHVKEGFRVELVAAEPLVEDPVAMRFDEDGRLWVVEMRGYMPTIDGEHEDAPVGRVVILDDTDDDGRMDTSTTFLDELVLPRAIGLAYGGALIVEPPNLLFCRDTDGDGVADERRVVWTGFGGIESPEHAGNGLIYGLDNWYACSQHHVRFRFDGETMATQRTPGHGQWGVTQDDFGRLYYTPNSHPLRGDVFSKHYAARNSNQRGVSGMFEAVSNDLRTWPIRVTPGVNRGYRKGTLTPEGKLASLTGACGPTIYRSTAFPEEFFGNAFICEPAGNLIKRNTMVETERGPKAYAAYEQSEFLASTDERFRPVQACVGPDGALYIADMYRGILQHRVFMTSFLRKQVIERELDKPIGLGRIYRIVHEAMPSRERPALSSASDERLVELLEHSDGWWRDTAQRLIVQRSAVGVSDRLRSLMRESADPLARQHALWTLEGLGTTAMDDVLVALDDSEWNVRVAGLRVAEQWIDAPEVLDRCRSLARDRSLHVRTQVALSLGEGESKQALGAIAHVVHTEPGESRIRSAALSGVHEEEVALLRHLFDRSEWLLHSPARERVIDDVIATALRSKSAFTRKQIIDLAEDRARVSPWQARAVLRAFGRAQRLETDKPRSIEIADDPGEQWRDLVNGGVWDISPEARAVDRFLAWPGRKNVVEGPRPMTRSERERFVQGRALYAHCATCHRSDGEGMPGLYPPLADSEWVLGDEKKFARILLHGLQGPIEVAGEPYDQSMPPAPWTDDDAIAAVMTYVRRAWGNDADPVSPDLVAQIRAEVPPPEPWTGDELNATP